MALDSDLLFLRSQCKLGTRRAGLRHEPVVQALQHRWMFEAKSAASDPWLAAILLLYPHERPLVVSWPAERRRVHQLGGVSPTTSHDDALEDEVVMDRRGSRAKTL